IESPALPVGRRSARVLGGRVDAGLAVECWYPADGDSSGPRAEYEVLPGISLRSAVAVEGAHAAAGAWPVVVFSHGRTGTSIAYSTLCEALAARGCIVVAPLHEGDALGDWLAGTQVDDRANESNRVADARHVIDAIHAGRLDMAAPAVADLSRLVLAGHSYGAYTAFALASSAAALPSADTAVPPSAVIGFQPYTRMLSDELLTAVSSPMLIVASEADRTTPPATDADRPWELVPATPSWRLDLLGAGHQAASDTALYAELADMVPELPDIVRAYLAASVDQLPAGRTWRDLMRIQVGIAWDFLQAAWSGDSTAGTSTGVDGSARLTRRTA
ncbi:MAG: alpha/beta hydrolase family protein, partial [Ilumatobacteraceae bacterium]